MEPCSIHSGINMGYQLHLGSCYTPWSFTDFLLALLPKDLLNYRRFFTHNSIWAGIDLPVILPMDLLIHLGSGWV